MDAATTISASISLHRVSGLAMTPVREVRPTLLDRPCYARDLRAIAPAPAPDCTVTLYADTREALLLPHEIAAEEEQAERDAHESALEAAHLAGTCGPDCPAVHDELAQR